MIRIAMRDTRFHDLNGLARASVLTEWPCCREMAPLTRQYLATIAICADSGIVANKATHAEEWRWPTCSCQHEEIHRVVSCLRKTVVTKMNPNTFICLISHS